MTPPPRLHDGLCAENPALWTTTDTGGRTAARRLCRSCPVLDQCKVYASRHRWVGVVVAGWAAPPNGEPERPPWARPARAGSS